MPTLVIGGSQSGVGKTSVAVGIMRALTNQGLVVQPFKVGPDFIDPGHHYRATGRISHNLDGWMLTRSQNLDLFQQACHGADIAIVEGVMGLFDGYGAESEAGSTAEIAKWLGAPVLLVINARALGRSAVALIYGYTQFDPDLNVVGIVCNRIGSPSHLDRIRTALNSSLPQQAISLTIAGLPRSEPATIPERHLGLWLAREDNLAATYIDTLAQLVQVNLDLEKLVNLAQKQTRRVDLDPVGQPNKHLAIAPPGGNAPVRIGVARDRAFCFYYGINLTLLAQAGATLIEFSPMHDSFPPDLDGLYLGGGYPELHAAVLSKNGEMRQAIATFCQSNRPVYAECGGLMYLSQGLISDGEPRYPFVGTLPFWTRMGTQVKLGYRQVDVIQPLSLFPMGETSRGHRFHYSDMVDDQGHLLQAHAEIVKLNPLIQLQYQVRGWGDRQTLEGYQIHNVLASYIHLHFGSNPAFAQRFVQRCRDLKLLSVS
ncbi:MAG: cobyrinate a,c-diamide synthase [Cyanothece sp. SIO2G6]|nr:cobyrinate a,c-diamide synthase [Cyanothece sp. SIO2G6]